MFLQTERLYLRRLTEDDAHFVYELLNSPGWLQYIGDRGITSLEKAKEYIVEKYYPSYDNGLGNYCLVRKEDNIAVGTCGLYQRANLEYPDIGFALLPEFFGKGYAYESAKSLLEYALNQLKLPKVYGFTLPTNEASKKLLIKIGLHENGNINFEDDPEELLLFST